jgi:hypothetical protein
LVPEDAAAWPPKRPAGIEPNAWFQPFAVASAEV